MDLLTSKKEESSAFKKELDSNKEEILINYTDSLNRINDSIIKSKDLEINSIKSKIESKDVEQTLIESQPKVTKQQRLRISDLKSEKTELKGSFSINRKDFGIGGKSISLSDNVTIALSVIVTE